MKFHSPASADQHQALWQFIESHKDSNVFQSREFYTIHKRTTHHEPFFCYVSGEDDEIQAVVCGVILSAYFWPVKPLTTRAVIYGSPLLANDDPLLLDFLLKHLNLYLGKRAVYTQFRNDAPVVHREIFEKRGFEYEDHLNILINLDRGKDAILAEISKNKRRNVTKSLNKACIFREVENREEYLASLALIRETYKKIKLPLAGNDLFTEAYDVMHSRGMLKAFGMYEDDKIIGIRIELLWKDKIYDWYAGSEDGSRNRYPNDFLPYHILLWANERGLKSFDWGGAGKPGVHYGVREHKLKFGGELVNFGRLYRKNNRMKYALGLWGLKVYKRLR